MKTMSMMKTFRNGLVWTATFAPVPLLACAACGSENPNAAPSPLASGMNAGILTLMGVILTVLTGIALFFVHIVRKEETKMNSSQDSVDV